MSDEFDSPREELDALIMLEDPAERARVIDRYRAQVLREAADFVRDAHFRDGLSVQEIGAALRYAANEG